MTLAEQIMNLRAVHPGMSSSEVGKRVGCHDAYVRTVWQRQTKRSAAVTDLGDDQVEFLRSLISAPRGIKDIKGEMSGQRRAVVIRRGYAEWIRPEGKPMGSAIGVQITQSGRAILASMDR